MAFLKKVVPNKRYGDIQLEGQQASALIGRDNECDIRICNIEMSRRHARLSRNSDKWQITDLESTNGVYVNNTKIKPLVSHILSDGESVSFGPPDKTEFVYKFHLKQEERSGQKNETKRIKRLEKQLEEHSKNQELLQKRLKQQELETKRKQAEIDRLTEQLKTEESEKQKLKETGEKQKKALKELKKKSKGDKQIVKCDNVDISQNSEQLNEGASTSGLQTKRKFEEIFDSELTCPICSELFIQPVHISCSHTFCTYCIELWKKNPNSHGECPICRKPMKHTSREIVLENLLDKIVAEMDDEDKQRRNTVVEERKKKLDELMSESSTSRIEDESYDSDLDSSLNFSDGPPSFASNFFAAFYNTITDASQDSNNSDYGEMEFSHEEEEDLEFDDEEPENGEMEDDYWEDEDMTPSEVDGYETANSYLIENGSVFSDTEFESSSEESDTSDSSDSSNDL